MTTNDPTVALDRPRYRATADTTVMPNGQRYDTGVEFVFVGWPRTAAGAIEPANDYAKRVLDYYAKHRHSPFIPSSPYNADHGRFYLPAVLLDPRSTRLPGIEANPVAGMPRYRTKFQDKFGGQTVDVGQDIAFTAWPVSSLDPINEEARAVVAYFEHYKGNPNILQAPWCCYSLSLVLPQLAGHQGKEYARDLSGKRDNWMNLYHGQIVGKAQDAIRTAAAETRRAAGATFEKRW